MDTTTHTHATQMFACSALCTETIAYCLSMGGSHAEAGHIKIMQDCADVCVASATLMARESTFHAQQCQVCAELCESCAASCAKLDGTEMERCASECRTCAELCRKMASGS